MLFCLQIQIYNVLCQNLQSRYQLPFNLQLLHLCPLDSQISQNWQTIILITMSVLNQNSKSRLTLSLNLTGSKQKIHKEAPQSAGYSKPIYPTTNSQCPSIKFSFDQQHLQQSRKKVRKAQLLAEREVLLNSLHALKGGAIMAIAQKQQQIEQLRQQLHSDDADDIQETISTLISDKKELLEEIVGLEQKLQSERQSYRRLLEEKDLVIEEIYVQMEQGQIEIEKLQSFVEMKENEISIIAEQNMYLLRQLQIQQIQKSQSRYQEQNDQNRRDGEKQDQNQALAETGNFMENEQYSEKGEHKIKSAVRHDKQIQSLTDYFEQRIAEIRQIYEKRLQYQSDSKQSNSNQLLEQVPSIRETSVNLHLLSKEFYTPAHLSDCYSLTKRFESKLGSQKASQFQREQDSDLKLFKRTIASPSTRSHTSTNIKDEGQPCIATTPNLGPIVDREKLNDKTAEKQMLSPVSSFLLGAVTGGSAACLFFALNRK